MSGTLKVYGDDTVTSPPVLTDSGMGTPDEVTENEPPVPLNVTLSLEYPLYIVMLLPAVMVPPLSCTLVVLI